LAVLFQAINTKLARYLSLNAAQRIYFVSKSEGRQRPGTGGWAKATGTRS